MSPIDLLPGGVLGVALCVNVSLHIPDSLLSDRTFLTHTLC